MPTKKDQPQLAEDDPRSRVLGLTIAATLMTLAKKPRAALETSSGGVTVIGEETAPQTTEESTDAN